jgi:hypothetical protein
MVQKLGLIGFVFFEPEGGFIFIILYSKQVCINLDLSEIGFVLHNLLIAAKTQRCKGAEAQRHTERTILNLKCGILNRIMFRSAD